ncbi:MAG: DUF1559 domain-containing protein [Planctomycetia bacterium]|nr:DUF1559 domain-containing protein [Planctomycetia bacterium]
MSLTFACECGKQLRAPEEFVGRQTKCPGCGRSVTVPAATAATLPAPALQAIAAAPALAPADPLPTAAVEPRISPLASSSIGLAALAVVLPLLLGIPVAVWLSAGWAVVVSLCMPLSLGVPAAILGIIGLSAINRGDGRLTGRGLAIGGLVLGLAASILGVVVGVGSGFVVALNTTKNSANRVVSANNLRQIGLAMLVYHDAVGNLPVADKKVTPLGQAKGLSWRVDLLPLLEENELYAQFKLDEPWDSPHNLKLVQRMPQIYRSPRFEYRGDGKTYYRALIGPHTILGGPKPFTLGKVQNFDGADSTLMVVEAAEPVIWTKPDELVYDPNGPLPKFGGPKQGDFVAVFADAHVETLSPKLGEKTLRAYITVDGNETIPPR